MFIYAILILIPALAFAQTHDELENKLFAALDGNKDGHLTQTETENYFLTFDTNKDGDISETEFKTAVDNLDPAFKTHEDTLYMLFERDANGHVNKADIDLVFKVVDIDGDGTVNKLEFHIIFSLLLSHTVG